MHTSAGFFGGVVVGGVLAAACGFDLFPEERTNGVQLTEAREALEKLKGAIVRSEARAGDLRSRLAQAETDLGERRTQLESANRERRVSEEEVEKRVLQSRAEAERAHGDLAKVDEELSAARRTLAAAGADVKSARTAVLDQLLRFFSRERDPVDARLVADYLATGASREEKQTLILEVLKRNKHLLLDLPHGGARDAPAEADPGRLGSGGDGGPGQRAPRPEAVFAVPASARDESFSTGAGGDRTETEGSP
ncbi:MAG TPA: hypothetical protein VMT52_19055 [Planctomycetota bacterium]|nr:hypothetical protein [Planctomycetota bacterium]